MPDRSSIHKTIRALRECDGDCRHCEELCIDVAAGDKSVCYAFRCGIAEGFLIRTDRLSELHGETVSHLFRELDTEPDAGSMQTRIY